MKGRIVTNSWLAAWAVMVGLSGCIEVPTLGSIPVIPDAISEASDGFSADATPDTNDAADIEAGPDLADAPDVPPIDAPDVSDVAEVDTADADALDIADADALDAADADVLDDADADVPDAADADVPDAADADVPDAADDIDVLDVDVTDDTDVALPDLPDTIDVLETIDDTDVDGTVDADTGDTDTSDAPDVPDIIATPTTFASRSSGNYPLGALFDVAFATADSQLLMTAPAPLRNLLYTWDFGDGTRTHGPLAAHVFTESRTVTLTIRDSAGTTETLVQDITVTHNITPLETICVSNSEILPLPPECGATVDASLMGMTAVWSLVQTGSYQQVLFHSGETFVDDSEPEASGLGTPLPTGFRIGIYGGIDKAVVRLLARNQFVATSGVDDVAIWGLRLEKDTETLPDVDSVDNFVAIGNEAGTTDELTLWNMEFQGFTTIYSIQTLEVASLERATLMDLTFYVTRSTEKGVFHLKGQGLAIKNFTLDYSGAADGTTARAVSIEPPVGGYGYLIQNSDLASGVGATGVGPLGLELIGIQQTKPVATPPTGATRVLVSGNRFDADFAMNTLLLAAATQVIIERNIFKADRFVADRRHIGVFYSGESTVRNNIFDLWGAGVAYAMDTIPDAFPGDHVVRFWHNACASDDPGFFCADGDGFIAEGNVSTEEAGSVFPSAPTANIAPSFWPFTLNPPGPIETPQDVQFFQSTTVQSNAAQIFIDFAGYCRPMSGRRYGPFQALQAGPYDTECLP